MKAKDNNRERKIKNERARKFDLWVREAYSCSGGEQKFKDELKKKKTEEDLIFIFENWLSRVKLNYEITGKLSFLLISFSWVVMMYLLFNCGCYFRRYI